MAQPRDYRERAFQLSPGALRGHFGERWVGLLGLLADCIAEGTQQAALSRNTLSGDQPDDALPMLLEEASLPRWPSASKSTLQQMLRDKWDIWALGGTVGGMVKVLSYFGLTAVTRSPHDWTWDGKTYWSRQWVVITSHAWSSEGTWGDAGTWGDGGVWGFDATPSEIQVIKATYNLFKPGHFIGHTIVVVTDPGSWTDSPTGDWEYWVNRDAGARYVQIDKDR